MKMKIAVFYENDKLSYLMGKKSRISIFDVQDDRVNGVENIKIEANSMDQMLSVLKEKSIDEVYVSEINNECENKFKAIGIKIKTAPMLRDDKLFNSLYILP